MRQSEDPLYHRLKNPIDLASSMEPCLVVVHPGQIPILGKKFREKILANSKDSLTECTRYAEDSGVMLCVENMPDIEGLLGKDINELDKMVEEIGAYMTLDVGHANNMGFDISEMPNPPL